MNYPEKHTKQFTLPMHTMFSIRTEGESIVAHALDFDIVAVAQTEEQAVSKLRVAVKHYIEYGLREERDSNVLFSAPKEFWDGITADSRISIGESLEIDHVRMITQITGGSSLKHETEAVASAA